MAASPGKRKKVLTLKVQPQTPRSLNEKLAKFIRVKLWGHSFPGGWSILAKLTK